MNSTVQTTGAVARVQLYIGSGVPSSNAPMYFNLSQTSPGLWSAAVTAPTNPGNFHYTVGVFNHSGHRVVVDNDNWNFTVQSASPSPQPLPDDVPLAPPFSYGSPVAASFSAEGRSIQGSEVTSDSRTDVPPSSVAQFYSARFPRAGWTIDPSTVPAAGATTFTIVATLGKRVCVVSFAAGTVHVFYGTLP